METVNYFVAAALLIALTFVVFRVFVRRDYQRKGRLTLRSSLLELLVMSLYVSFPFLYNPPQWVSFWSREVPVSEPLRLAGVACIAIGLVSAFGTMLWFGLRRAFGLQVKGLIQSGPYRVTRNPQLVGFSLVVLGVVALWPSWYAVGWVMLYGVVGHVMVMTEEEHLLAVHGEAYARYCQRVPRYVGLWWKLPVDPRLRRTAGFAKPEEGAMKPIIEFLVRVALLVFIVCLFWWVSDAPLASGVNLSIIIGGVMLTFPLVWLGRQILDRDQTRSHVAWITTFVHFSLGFTLGVPIVRAIATHQDWSGWVLPVPPAIGMGLVAVTGVACLLVVANLALKGVGAPFFIALSQKLAADWLYAWTRNPMVLAGLAFLLSLGIWFQSALFVLWVLSLPAPALPFFVKVYEERELESRFGASYLEYKSRTPMLMPRRPKG